MFFEIKEKHHLPHIHIRYQGYKASVAIENATLLAGGRKLETSLRSFSALVTFYKRDLGNFHLHYGDSGHPTAWRDDCRTAITATHASWRAPRIALHPGYSS